MMDRLPAVTQISAAHYWLDMAHRQATAIHVCGSNLPTPEVYQRLFQTYMTHAVRALGYTLSPAGPRLAVDNDAEQPITFGR